MSPDKRPDSLIGYCRVSTAGQAANGISLAEQQARIRRYCEAHGIELVAFAIDTGASGKSMKRPALQRALKRLKRGEAEGIVAVRLDRITRSIRDTVTLIERAEKEGWTLVSLNEQLDTSTAMGRFVVNLLAALAQLEREQIGERTREALAELRRQGKRTSGRPPFGYRHARNRLVPVPEEQRILKRMIEIREEGAGLRTVARRLTEECGGNPRTGRGWHPSTIGDILRATSRSLG